MNAIHGRKHLARWGAGVTLAGFLAGGGIALALTSGAPAPASAGTASAGTSSAGTSSAGTTSGDPQQAASLNSVISTGTSPAHRVRWPLARLRRLGGTEGTVTFRGKSGFRTLAFERGTVQSVAGGKVVVKSPDGTIWTWAIVGDTVVRKNGAKTGASALSAGEAVFAAGPVIAGNRDARLIVIRTGSESAQTSLS